MSVALHGDIKDINNLTDFKIRMFVELSECSSKINGLVKTIFFILLYAGGLFYSFYARKMVTLQVERTLSMVGLNSPFFINTLISRFLSYPFSLSNC
jgi:hypothetical protein